MPDQRISIKVTDDFEVKSVMLAIHNADGTLVEEGNAVKGTTDQHWIYTTSADNPTLEGDRITIRATDNPDNLSVEQRILSLPRV